MGQMRFRAPTPKKLPPHAVEAAYVAGLEAVPWRGSNTLIDRVLTIERTVSESGNLYIPWDIPGIGPRVLSTCTLMERGEPYFLTTELARGTLHRARSLAAELESTGKPVSASASDLLHQAIREFITAAIEPAAAEEAACQTILLASQAIQKLSSQAIEAGLEDNDDDSDLPTILVGALSNALIQPEMADAFLAAFHAVSIPFRWRRLQATATAFDWDLTEQQLKWSQTHGMRTIGGPLIQLDRLSLPDWTYGLEDDYDRFEIAAIDYVRTVVERFASQVDIWLCAGRLNVTGALAFSEEQKLRLAVATIEAVRSVAPRAPVVISFDQPWAEYLGAEDYDLSPLHFADALVRADLGVAAVALEMNLGYCPGGTKPRDLMAISQHMDRWSLLGIPLLAYLTMPSQTGNDAQAIGPARVIPQSAEQLEQPAFGQDMAAELIRLLLTKPVVHGIAWNHWSDAEEHEYPHAGLVDAAGHPKPLLATLADIRRKYLS